MAIQGNAYIKTTWAFEERPVASAKLNAWDDRIEAALELAYLLLAHAWGGGDGVIRAASEGDLEVVAASPGALHVVVRPGYAFIEKVPYKLAQDTPTPGVVPPSQEPRIDLVQARLATWDIAVKPGTEAAEPETPPADAGAIPLAALYLRPGMNSIEDADDSTNGYIIDARQFL